MVYNILPARLVNDKVMADNMIGESNPAMKNESRYHHGDLRRELLRVARAEIARHGAQSVSLTSLARLAGVSQPAPYRHFPDRASLLEAAAAEAFVELAATLANAVTNESPIEALKKVAAAYMHFGEANNEVYRLMFASRLTSEAKTGSDLDEASTKAFDLLRTALSTITAANADEDAYLFWAQMHGLVMLKADGFITRPLDRFVEGLCRRGAGLDALASDPGCQDLSSKVVPPTGSPHQNEPAALKIIPRMPKAARKSPKRSKPSPVCR